MITNDLLKLLARKVPNYHLVSPKFAKESFSLCTCSKCRFCLLGKSYGTPEKDGKPQRNCKRVFDELLELGEPTGHSLVAEYGTCDAARFSPQSYDNFQLEAETVSQQVEGDQHETSGDGFGIDKPAPWEVPAPQQADNAAEDAETTHTDVPAEGGE